MQPYPFWLVAIVVVTPISVYMFFNTRVTGPIALCFVAAMAIMLFGYATPMGEVAMGVGSPFGLYGLYRSRPGGSPADAAASRNPLRDRLFWLAVGIAALYAVGNVYIAQFI